MAGTEERKRQVFAQLKPVCVLLMNPLVWKSPKVDAAHPLSLLQSQLEQVCEPPGKDAVVGDMLEYIMFPLMQLINYPGASMPAMEKALVLIADLLELCPANAVSPPLFRQLLVSLPFIISMGRSVPNKNSTSSVSEELKLAGVRCLQQLIMKSGEHQQPLEVRRSADLQNKEYQHVVAHLVVTMLDIMERIRNVELRVQACNTIRLIIENVRDPDVTVHFLPGVSSALAKIITNDDKENHRIIVVCLQTLEALCSAVMRDDLCQSLVCGDNLNWADLVRLARRDPTSTATPISSTTENAGLGVDYHESGERATRRHIQRDAAWLQTSASRLNHIFARIFTIRHHPEWRVRLAVLHFASGVILSCSQSMFESMPLLVETVVFYVCDEFPTVRSDCAMYIEKITSTLRHRFSLSSILTENFYNLMMRLPRHIMKSGDRKKVEMLRITNGYLLLLKESIGTALAAMLPRISSGMLKVLTFESGETKLVEDRTTSNYASLLEISRRTGPGDLGVEVDSVEYPSQLFTYSFPRKRFVYFRDEEVTQHMSLMLRLLGFYGDLHLLTEHFAQYVRSTATGDFQAQAIYVINELCFGAAGFGIPTEPLVPKPALDAMNAKAMVKFVANEYVQSPLLTCPTNFGDVTFVKELMELSHDLPRVQVTGSAEPNVGDLSLAILKISLLLEGLSVCAQVLQKDFRRLLIDVLYAVLEKVGDSNRVVSDSAMRTLQAIASSCGYGEDTSSREQLEGVRQMILSNVDYIVNAVSRRLRHLSDNPWAPSVLKAAVRIARSDIITYMNDPIEEILDALDQWHNKNEWVVLQLVEVLDEIVTVLKPASDPHNADTNSPDVKATSEPVPSHDLPAALLESSTELLEFYLSHKYAQSSSSSPNDDADDNATAFFTRLASEKDKEESSEQVPDTEQVDADNQAAEPRSTPPSQSQILAMKIMDKILHYSSGPNARLRARSLRILTRTLGIINDRTLDLDPRIHTLWPTIVRRLGDKEHYVVMEALATISMISNLSGGFVARRIADDIVPRFVALMRNLQVTIECETSRDARAAQDKNLRAITTTQMKTSVHALGTMREILLQVPVMRTAVNQVVEVIVPFLNGSWYSPDVVDAASALLISVVDKRDAGDATWLAVWTVIGGRSVDPQFRKEQRLLKSLTVPTWVSDKWRKKGTARSFEGAGVRVLQHLGHRVIKSSTDVQLVLDEGVTYQWKLTH
ncbi:TEL2-interacting protein 1 [Gaertneriomyces sp. JEL0708]|nr:TEL2-interacting protein 1 [Gaertneriomyces sp. JEL0708]